MIITIDTEKDVTPEQLRKIFNILSPPRSTVYNRKKTESVPKPSETTTKGSYFDSLRSDANRFDPTPPDDPAYKLTPEKAKELADKANNDPEFIAKHKQWLKDHEGDK